MAFVSNVSLFAFITEPRGIEAPSNESQVVEAIIAACNNPDYFPLSKACFCSSTISSELFLLLLLGLCDISGNRSLDFPTLEPLQ